MHILLLPNSLKGSLSARQTARVLCQALQKKHTVRAVALSDGGDGFIDFFSTLYPSARKVYLSAQNAFGKSVRTSYLWIPKQKTAVLETAQICGLGQAKKEELNPLGASSFGVGQVLLHALKKGAKKIYIGLGGVACNDGGAGIVQALGALFLDKHNRALRPGAKPLLQLRSVEFSALRPLLRGVQIYAVADVINPMLGPQGSARVYGPQKGATPAQVRTLEKALCAYARVLKRVTGKDIGHTPSTGAAGALCASLYALCGAKIILGADFLRTHLPLATWAKRADLIITCEGKLDHQTLFGKAPLAVLQVAKAQHKPVLFICGQWEGKVLQKLPRGTQLKLICLSDFAADTADSINHAGRYLRRAVQTL
ncbi:MAG: glycerate kinase [Elusimicrobiaceae bacterium]|nr:glycerate kinase [Elusimicrobiaceae bacterium]